MLAGGRYDGLIGSLGGPETAGVGWAAGIERLAMLLEEPVESAPRYVLLPHDDRGEAAAAAYNLLFLLRRKNILADIALSGKRDRRIQRAAVRGANAMLFVDIEQGQFLHISHKPLNLENIDDNLLASVATVLEDAGYTVKPGLDSASIVALLPA